MTYSDKKPDIELVEVAPRDGLQSLERVLSISDKAEIISICASTGVKRMEVVSFVRDDAVPAMAGAEKLLTLLPNNPNIVYIGLVLNKRGLTRALSGQVQEIGVVCAASDSFGLRNQGMDRTTSIREAFDIVRTAKEAGRRSQATLAVSFGCPYEGVVACDGIIDAAYLLAEAGADEVALADTIGAAVPEQVYSVVSSVRKAIAPVPVRGHFHNTRNMGIANVWAAVQAGARTIDTSLGGLGGCPFAPGATGNVATEDVAYLLSRSGIPCSVDLEKSLIASRALQDKLDMPLDSALLNAGGFPSVYQG